MASFSACELSVDSCLGYPPAFAKLCSNPLPIFPESPSKSSIPHHLPPRNFAQLNELDSLFPIISHESDSSDEVDAMAYAEYLWSQLDHLGNAGFDPAEFRIDPYGNVLYWDADPSSPLAWELNLWFPKSRGGKTLLSNLRLVQWQVARCKDHQLEFLMPSWDLQLGVSVNQFINIFASTNTEFRHRSLSLLFGSDINVHHLNHDWPEHFKHEAEIHGYGPAAVVRVRKQMERTASGRNESFQAKWRNFDEDGVILRPLHISNCCTCPCQYMNQMYQDCEENLMVRQSSACVCIQKEKECGRKLGLEIRHKQEQVAFIERELKIIKQHNEREKMVLEDLETTLSKHKKRLEKQRHWSETQSHYRQCLERIIKDTLQQSYVFREKARLNQAACGTLLAKINESKINFENAENVDPNICTLKPEQQHFSNIPVSNECENTSDAAKFELVNMSEENCVDVVPQPKLTSKYMDTILEEDELNELDDNSSDVPKSPLKRKVLSSDLDDNTGKPYQRLRVETGHVNIESQQNTEPSHQLDGILHELLTFKSAKEDSATDSGNNEIDNHRYKRIGKSNVDKLLKLLLHNSNNSNQPQMTLENDVLNISDKDVCNGDKSKKGLDGLFHRMSLKHDSKKLKVLKERAKVAHDDVKNVEVPEDQFNCNISDDGIPSPFKDLNVMELFQNLQVNSKEVHDVSKPEDKYTESDVQSSNPFVLDVHSKFQHENDNKHNHQEPNVSEKPSLLSISTRFPSDSQPSYPEKMQRSYSMRVFSTTEKWNLHTRSGSDAFLESTPENEFCDKKADHILQSSSVRDTSMDRASHSSDAFGFAAMGLKASIKTCSKAWKRAVSKRRSSNRVPKQ